MARFGAARALGGSWEFAGSAVDPHVRWLAQHTDMFPVVFPGLPREVSVCIEEAPSPQI